MREQQRAPPRAVLDSFAADHAGRRPSTSASRRRETPSRFGRFDSELRRQRMEYTSGVPLDQVTVPTYSMKSDEESG